MTDTPSFIIAGSLEQREIEDALPHISRNQILNSFLTAIAYMADRDGPSFGLYTASRQAYAKLFDLPEFKRLHSTSQNIAMMLIGDYVKHEYATKGFTQESLDAEINSLANEDWQTPSQRLEAVRKCIDIATMLIEPLPTKHTSTSLDDSAASLAKEPSHLTQFRKDIPTRIDQFIALLDESETPCASFTKLCDPIKDIIRKKSHEIASFLATQNEVNVNYKTGLNMASRLAMDAVACNADINALLIDDLETWSNKRSAIVKNLEQAWSISPPGKSFAVAWGDQKPMLDSQIYEGLLASPPLKDPTLQ